MTVLPRDHRPTLARSTVLNLAGLGTPLVVAFFAIPVLTRWLGTDRFGVLSLVWVVLGYFSLFDLGLSRALTQIISERVSSLRTDDLPQLVWTGLGLLLGLGLITTLVATACSAWLVNHVLHIPPVLQSETER